MPPCWRTISSLARYFEAAAKGAKKPKNVANWILNDLQNALGAAGKGDKRVPDSAGGA